MLAAETVSKEGDTLFVNKNGIFQRLAIGSNGASLVVSNGLPAWQAQGYGHMYIYNLGTGSTTITVAATDTYYQIGSGVTGGLVSGFTFQNARELKALNAGTYFITFSMVVECSSSSQAVEGAVMINGVANTTVSGHSNIGTSNKPMTLSGNGIVTLAANDLVSTAVLNHSSINNITIDHLMLTILRIG
ncbi:MAG TPA: hypothetical protein VF941_03125 [Clostridia bacterium]